MKVFYHHVPRTGGTSIAKIAEKNYGKNIFYLNSSDKINYLIDYFETKKNYFIFCDSLSISNIDVKKVINLCDIDIISIRNPIKRFESFYNIWRDTNHNEVPYAMDDKNLSIDEFYLECKEQNKNFLLNSQHKYLNLYNPNRIIKTEDFAESMKILKNLDIFPIIEKDDLIPLNKSNNNFQLSAKLIEDYKISFPEDINIMDKL